MKLLTLNELTTTALSVAQISGFGPWNSLLTFLLSLVAAAGGVGIAAGIGMLALAGGRQEYIEKGKNLIEGSFGGVLIGIMAVAVFDIIVKVVVGF